MPISLLAKRSIPKAQGSRYRGGIGRASGPLEDVRDQAKGAPFCMSSCFRSDQRR
jgi:hypothetical protein